MEKTLIKTAQAQNGPIPAHILSAPELGVGLEFWHDSFQKLTTCRPPSMGGFARIPWTAVSQFCHDYEIEGEDREDFEYVMSHVDNNYITFLNERAEEEVKRKEKAPRKPRTK